MEESDETDIPSGGMERGMELRDGLTRNDPEENM